MNKVILRSQLQVDASPSLKRVIKQIAAEEGKSQRELVLEALAKQYPQLRPYVESNLQPIYRNGQ